MRLPLVDFPNRDLKKSICKQLRLIDCSDAVIAVKLFGAAGDNVFLSHPDFLALKFKLDFDLFKFRFKEQPDGDNVFLPNKPNQTLLAFKFEFD